jgi:Questin oxidase-like
VTISDTGILNEAYERFHTTGPEFADGLTNHGPMAVEAMVRHGHDAQVHAWIDWYQTRLEDAPRGITPVTAEDWREALGDVKRLGDWTTFMLREVQLRPWRDLLVEWWPRLLPGITGSATHGVIRVGHSVRALLAEEKSPTDGPRLAEFAHALAYWAARWTPLNLQPPPHTGPINPSAAQTAPSAVPKQKISSQVPPRTEPTSPSAALAATPADPEQKTGAQDSARAGLTGQPAATSATSEQKVSAQVPPQAGLIGQSATLDAIPAAPGRKIGAQDPARAGLIGPSAALAAIPGVHEQKTSATHRLSQLSETPGWSEAFGSLRAPESPRQAAELLSAVIDAAVLDYLVHGHANPVMLVHASTAPTAVLRTLPALPEDLWIPSLDAAWLATAAITAAYRNTDASAEDIAAAVAQAGDPQEGFDRAVRHGDEHVVKFADTALDSYERTGDRHALAAATRATLMIKVS